MSLIEFLSSKSGLLFIQLEELAFFITLFYILFVEWKRTKRLELRSKLVAVSAAITQILVSSITLFLEIFYNIIPSELVVPVLISTLTITTIIFLWHAFLYSSLKNTQKIIYIGRTILLSLLLVFSSVLVLWNLLYEPGMIFQNSHFYLSFEIAFILIDIAIIYTISRFKAKYKARVIYGFLALLFLHLLNMYSFITHSDPLIRFVRTALPIVVPIMFGSVMYKELLDHLVNLNRSLRQSLSGQGELILNISEIDYKLNSAISEMENTMNEFTETESNEQNRKLQDEMKHKFSEIKDLLASVDDSVFKIMQNVGQYNDVIMK